MVKGPLTPRQRKGMRKIDKRYPPMSNSPAVYNRYAQRQRRLLWWVALAIIGVVGLAIAAVLWM